MKNRLPLFTISIILFVLIIPPIFAQSEDVEDIEYQLTVTIIEKTLQTGDNAKLYVFLKPQIANEEIVLTIKKSGSEILSDVITTNSSGFGEYDFVISDIFEGRYLAIVSAEINGKILNAAVLFTVKKVEQTTQSDEESIEEKSEESNEVEMISQPVFEPPQPTQIEESNEDEGLSKADLIRKYCYLGSDGIMYDRGAHREICPYGTRADLEDKLQSGQYAIILITVGIIAVIIARFVVNRKRRSGNVKKALTVIDNLLKAEIGNPEQLESIKEKLENKTLITEDEVAYLQEKMKQLE